MEGEDHLLEGRGMLLAQQVVDEGGVLAEALRAGPVGDPGGLDDALVAPQVVHEADEAFVEHGELAIQYRFGGGHEAVRHGASIAL